MKNIYFISIPGAAMAMAMAAWLPLAATAADASVKRMKEGENSMKMEGKMMEDCQAMMDQKEKMKADLKVQNDEITGQVARMNRAPQDQKTELMAALLTHMVEQRIAMDARKAKMEEEMMQHMMQHMEMGRESMAQCPMMKGMKGMKGMDGKSGAAHKEHPPEKK